MESGDSMKVLNQTVKLAKQNVPGIPIVILLNVIILIQDHVPGENELGLRFKAATKGREGFTQINTKRVSNLNKVRHCLIINFAKKLFL